MRLLINPLAAIKAVEEHTLALMLSLIRIVIAADRSLEQYKWEKRRFSFAPVVEYWYGKSDHPHNSMTGVDSTKNKKTNPLEF
jgi:hypothetical protein